MRIASIALLACALSAGSNGADAPATAPAPAHLLNGQVDYIPPAGWKPVKTNASSEMEVVYLADDRDGFFALIVLPENAATDAKAAQIYVDALRASHKSAGQAMVQEPQIEKDERFALKIHERYKTKDGKVADESYAYRRVEGRAMEVHVQSLSTDAAHVAGVRKTAENVLLSARFNGTAPATPAAPAVPATLFNGRIEFNQPPAPWIRGKVTNLTDDSAATYGIEGKERWLMVRLLPLDASISPETGKQIVFTLRTRHKKSNQEMLDGPTLEKDSRFAIRIHERYRESADKVVDETHFFMQVAGRAMELDVHTAGEDDKEMQADRKVGEDVMASSHWKRARPQKKGTGQ